MNETMSEAIWIRCREGSEIHGIRESILNFIKEDQTLAGDIPVKVFLSKESSTFGLSHIYDMSESAVNVLKEKFGDENVKLSRKEIDNKSSFALDRLIDVLEGINDNLSCICMYIEYISDHAEDISEHTKALSNCVSETRYGNRFCVTGGITHYEP